MVTSQCAPVDVGVFWREELLVCYKRAVLTQFGPSAAPVMTAEGQKWPVLLRCARLPARIQAGVAS